MNDDTRNNALIAALPASRVLVHRYEARVAGWCPAILGSPAMASAVGG